MLLLKDTSNLTIDGTVTVESISKIGSFSEQNWFILDIEDYIALKNTHWYNLQDNCFLRQHEHSKQQLNRFILEARGFAPPTKYRTYRFDNDFRNHSKNNMMIKIHGGDEFKAPRGVIHKDGLYKVQIPLIEEELLLTKPDIFTDVNPAILDYRQKIKEAYPEFWEALI